MQLAWIGAVPITPEWQESVAGSTIRGQFVRRFSSIYGDIQQHDISCLCDGITTRQDVFAVPCSLQPIKRYEQCLHAAGSILPQAQNLGCDSHDYL